MSGDLEAAIQAVTDMDAAPEPVAAPVVDDKPEISDTEIVEPETADAEADEVDGDESDDDQAEAVESVEAPQWWDAEAKAEFAALTPKAQAIVRAQEEKREAVVAKVKAESSEARTLATTEANKAKELADRMAAAITDERKAFDEYFTDIDWNAYLLQDRDAAQADWMRYQTGLEKFNKAENDRAAADKLWRENFMREESAKLTEIAPDIANNAETLRGIGDYIVKSGISPDALLTVSALELTIAHKAMMYDKMMAEATSKTVPPKTPTVTKPAKVAPQGATGNRGTSSQRDISQQRNRLAQTRSIDDAAKLITKLGF